MRIQTNIAALSAHRNLAATNHALQATTTRLSSGFRINRAGDDAAGLSIANTMRGDVRALQQASRNASQAGSLLQVADGATGTIASILDRMKELATQASSANVDDNARVKIQAEFVELQAEIGRITQSTKFQGANLLDGTFGLATDTANAAHTVDTLVDGGGDERVTNINVSGAKASSTYTLAQPTASTVSLTDAAGNVQVITIDPAETGKSYLNFDQLGVSFTVDGAIAATDLAGLAIRTSASDSATFRVGIGEAGDGAKISLSLGNLTTAGLEIDTLTLDTAANADLALAGLDAAYSQLNDVVGQIGAAQNRLEFASDNVSNMIQNTMAAESVIRDADMAYEMMQFSKQNILAQAGTAMLAQANSLSQSVLQLLR